MQANIARVESLVETVLLKVENELAGIAMSSHPRVVSESGAGELAAQGRESVFALTHRLAIATVHRLVMALDRPAGGVGVPGDPFAACVADGLAVQQRLWERLLSTQHSGGTSVHSDRVRVSFTTAD